MVCQSTLKWYELIPLFSFLALRGRCRSCSVRLSLQYPLVEFSTGVIYTLLFLKFENLFYQNTISFTFTFAYYALMFSLLLVISVYDMKHKIIPDDFSLAFGMFAFLGMFVFTANGFALHIPAMSQFLAGLLVSFPFALIWFFSKGEWMGFGDAKLAVGLGFLLGFSSLLSAVTIAFWLGSIIGILLIILNKLKGMKSEMPLAPYLALGTFLVFIFELNLFYLF